MLYSLICFFSISIFWIFNHNRDALGFSLIHIYILHPISIVLISFFLGKSVPLGKWTVLTALLIGFEFMMTDFLTFRLANMTAFNTLRYPEYSLIAAGAIVSLAGFLIGALVRKIIRKN